MKRGLVAGLVGLAVALLAGAEPASAGDVDEMRGWEAPALAAAETHWGQTVFDPVPREHYGDCDSLTIQYGPLTSGAEAWVQATTGSERHCMITVDPSYPWTWDTYCASMLHEVGHHLGYKHESGGVMVPGAWGPWPACVAHAPQVPIVAPPSPSLWERRTAACRAGIRARSLKLKRTTASLRVRRKALLRAKATRRARRTGARLRIVYRRGVRWRRATRHQDLKHITRIVADCRV